MKSHRAGNAIVESLLVIPLLSIILVGTYAFGNTLSMLSTAESAAHSEALRHSRNQPSMQTEWNRQVPEPETPFRFEFSTGNGTRILPAPFPSLSSRAIVSVRLDRDWDSLTNATLGFKRQAFERKSELSGDCWGSQSASGKKIRNAVKILVGTGVF